MISTRSGTRSTSSRRPPSNGFERAPTARAVSDAGAAFVVSPIPTRERRGRAANLDAVRARAVPVRRRSVTVGRIRVRLRSPRRARPDREPSRLARRAHRRHLGGRLRNRVPRRVDARARRSRRAVDQGPYSERARVLLSRHASEVMRLLARYDQLADEARRSGHPNGADPRRTAFRKRASSPSAGPVLIDWDTTMIAPPERDLWMLESGDGKVVDTYTKVTGTEVLPPMLDLYRLRWDLTKWPSIRRSSDSPTPTTRMPASRGRTSTTTWASRRRSRRRDRRPPPCAFRPRTGTARCRPAAHGSTDPARSRLRLRHDAELGANVVDRAGPRPRTSRRSGDRVRRPCAPTSAPRRNASASRTAMPSCER